MATELRGFTISAIADVDLSDKQFHVVKLLENGNIDICDEGDVPVGILQNQPYKGQAAAVMVTGQSKVVVGDTAIVAGERVASVGGVVFTEKEGNHTIGQCREGAGPGQIASVLINCFNTTEKPAEITEGNPDDEDNPEDPDNPEDLE